MGLSTAKTILKVYRKEGRIGPKISRNRANKYDKFEHDKLQPVRNVYCIKNINKNPFCPYISIQEKKYEGENTSKREIKFKSISYKEIIIQDIIKELPK